MNKITNNQKYFKLVDNILEDEKFLLLGNIEHHGINRYEHSLRVSYYSYYVTKTMGLDYKKAARAGLLHDFFFSDENRTFKDKIISTFVHPKEAVKNADTYFGITDLEKDIIASHMFPINLSVPKYAESWVINLVDKTVAIYEFYHKFSYKFIYIMNLYLLFVINCIK
ncbi:MAG: HD domain-containing protein [Bacilli bacterium]|nr:HD domain-containing protein [Bacilli bacterium]